MLSRRATAAFSARELQALHSQWLRSGKCYRCFHASLRQRADDAPAETNQATPINVPQRGPTRQQRSAMVSQELQILQRDRLSPTFAESDPETLRPPGASQTVDPEALGSNVGTGSTGENDTASQEGPLAQGINMEARTGVDAEVDTRAARNTGQAVTMGAASESAGSGLETGLGASTGARLEAKDQTQESQPEEKDTPSPHAVEPRGYSKAALLHRRRGSTIAAGDFQGIVEDRLATLTGPHLDEGERDHTTLARRLLQRQFVQFQSKEERAAVLEEAKRIAPPVTSEDGSTRQVLPDVRRLPNSVRTNVIDRMVAGLYETDGLLQGEEKFKQPVLNDIARATAINGTYLKADGERLLKKVRSLLPVSTQQSQRKATR